MYFLLILKYEIKYQLIMKKASLFQVTGTVVLFLFLSQTVPGQIHHIFLPDL